MSDNRSIKGRLADLSTLAVLLVIAWWFFGTRESRARVEAPSEPSGPLPPPARPVVATSEAVEQFVAPAPHRAPAPARRPRRRIPLPTWAVIVTAAVALTAVAALAVALVDTRPARSEERPTVTQEPTPGPADAALPIGAYIGPGDRAGFEKFGQWLGRTPVVASDGLEELRWSAIVDPYWLLDAWRDVPSDVAYSLVMIPRDEGGSLEKGAAGAYDGYFTQLAEKLIAGGQAKAILRPGWEFSGDWQPWSARTDPAAWRAYYRRIVETMRGVPGAEFRFVWNPALGPIDPDNWPAERAWPGGDVVDLIGVDPYDVCFSPGTYPIPADASDADQNDRRQRCWNELLTGDHGLEWYAAFARRHDRPLVIPEFGLVPQDRAGGGDNPIFIRGMAEFARDNDVKWLVYFNKQESELGNHRIDDDTYPRSSEVFRSLFGPDPPVPAG